MAADSAACACCRWPVLAVVGDGLVGVRGLATHGDLAEEWVGMRLVATPGVGMGEFEKAFCKRACLVYAADEE